MTLLLRLSGKRVGDRIRESLGTGAAGLALSEDALYSDRVPGMKIREVSITSRDAQHLIGLLDEELGRSYAPEHIHTVDAKSFQRDGGVFIVMYDDQIPLGCAALRKVDRADVELKRMFIVEAYRGRGLSKQLLIFMEARALSHGYSRLILETGDSQIAAQRLYEACGFEKIAPFGEYIDGPHSVCYAKTLDNNCG